MGRFPIIVWLFVAVCLTGCSDKEEKPPDGLKDFVDDSSNWLPCEDHPFAHLDGLLVDANGQREPYSIVEGAGNDCTDNLGRPLMLKLFMIDRRFVCFDAVVDGVGRIESREEFLSTFSPVDDEGEARAFWFFFPDAFWWPRTREDETCIWREDTLNETFRYLHYTFGMTDNYESICWNVNELIVSRDGEVEFTFGLGSWCEPRHVGS